MCVDRDDQILLTGLLLYVVSYVMEEASKLPLWRTDGMIIIFLLHIGPVEFLYYWLHRALHHHYLYSRYHSHHHSSIVTQPITCKSFSLQHFLSHFVILQLLVIGQFFFVFSKIKFLNTFLFLFLFLKLIGLLSKTNIKDLKCKL